jgi:GT2 family glycosyltransferase
MTDVRVGIVTWNTAECIGACLDALPAALAGLDAEVVVVDNASSDDSVAIAERHPGVRVVRNPDNRGYARAMNQALRGEHGARTDAEFLIALNPDTRCPPGALARLVQFLRDHDDVGLVAPRLLNDDGSLQHSVHRFPSPVEAAVMGFVPPPARPGPIGRHWWLEGAAQGRHERVEDVDWMIGAVHCIRASALGSLGPYDETWFMYVEDLDLCWQLRERNWRVVLAGDVEVTHIGNVAGEKAWGAAREARWLDAMYEWYEREHGRARLRVWSLVNVLAAITKLAVVRVLSLVPARAEVRDARRERRTMLEFMRTFHREKLRGAAPSTRARRRRRAHRRGATIERPELLAISPSGFVSGAEMVLLRDLQAARDAGWSVRCACPPGPLVERLTAEGIARVRIPDLKLSGGGSLGRVFALGRALLRSSVAARRIRALEPRADLVLVNGLNALLATRLSRVKVPRVWLAHDVITRADRLALLRIGGPAVDFAIAVSDAVAQPLRTAGVAAAVVHNGVAWPVAPAPGEPPSPPVVGCVALLTSWKGQLVLLDAIARLRRRDVVVELVGGAFPSDAGYVRELHDRASRPDLRGRVQFVGHLADPLARVRTWTVSVSASIDPEAGPLTAIESMSVGVPVVATAHGGVVEVLDGAGLLVPPRDIDALAHAIDRLVSDTELHQRCSEAGRRAVPARHLTIPDHQQRVVALLDRALAIAGVSRVPGAPVSDGRVEGDDGIDAASA